VSEDDSDDDMAQEIAESISRSRRHNSIYTSQDSRRPAVYIRDPVISATRDTESSSFKARSLSRRRNSAGKLIALAEILC